MEYFSFMTTSSNYIMFMSEMFGLPSWTFAPKIFGEITPKYKLYHHSNSRKSYRMFELNIAKLNK